MKKIMLFWQFVTVMFCSCNDTLNAQNIAKDKSYTFSSHADYALTSADTDHKLLTDGIYTGSNFWTSKTTVGWQYKKRISIEIDLKQLSAIDRVTFNSVRGNAGVRFPSNIFVFVSTDKMSYIYIGDAAVDSDNVSGDYKIKKFTLNEINRTARYVQFVIIPNGAYVFCDEIEVLAGNSSKKTTSKNQINIANVNGAVDSLQKVKSNYKKMAYQIGRIRASFNNSESYTTDKPSATTQETKLIEGLTSAKAERLRALRLKYGNTIIIDKVNPWDVLSAPYKPQNNKGKAFNIITTINGVQYGAFAISNLSNFTQTFDCYFDTTPNSISSNELFIVPFITSGNQYKEIADPLINASKSKKLEQGETGIYLFKITGVKSGQNANNIVIRSKYFTTKLLINTTVLSQASFSKKYSLNTNNWAYLTYPLISDRQDEAVTDLLAHHINTMVVPPDKVPIVGSNDFSAFTNYLVKLKRFQNIFLYMSLTSAEYKNSFKQYGFMTDAWKSKFNVWYDGIIQSAKSVGFSPSQIFLYPYDEVQGENIQQYSIFLKWLKAYHPNISTFSTLSTKQAVDELMPSLTISQVANSGNLIKEIDTRKYNNVWFYDTQANAELLSPYSYYRLMAWKGFFYGYKGIGFWNYADYVNGSTNKIDIDNFDGVNSTNYSVIYNDRSKGLISSRRWEAFRLGIEDYELLKMYAEKKGLDKAKQLAEIVINNPNNLDKADLIRNEILQSLTR